jgi:drug/metabolite transporter (DMT)-like permease
VTGLSRETLGLLVGFVGIVVFAGTLPATRIAVETLDPVFVGAGRAALAAAVALPLLLALRRPFPAKDELGRLALSGVLLVAGFPILTSWAMTMLPVAHGSVFLGFIPLVTAACGAVLARERPSPLFWAAALTGAAVIVAYAMRATGKAELAKGDLVLLGAGLSAGLGYAISAGVAKRMPGWEVVSWQVVIMLPLTVPVTLWWGPVDPSAVGLRHWLAFGYAGLFSMYIGFFFWNAGLAMGGVARVSQVQLLQTFVTLLIVGPVNGEKTDAFTWLAAAAVVATILVGRKAGMRRG